jgi:SAM-dependent methyltransferase
MKDKIWDSSIAASWNKFKPPIRPSSYDLEIFEKFIDEKIKEKGDNVKILILGSTPEIRDLVSLKKIVPYVCEYSKNNYEALKLLKKEQGDEILINQDWRELKTDEKFDLVFAEASLNVISKEDVPIVLKKVTKILKEDGLLISKNWTRDLKEGLTEKKMIEEWGKRNKNKNIKSYINLRMMYSYLYDEKNNSLPLRKKHSHFKDMYEKGVISKEEFNKFNECNYDKTALKLYIPLEHEWKKILSKDMKIIEKIIPKPLGKNIVPIYVLKK